MTQNAHAFAPTRRTILALATAIGLAACTTGPTGPLIGVWQGEPPGPEPSEPQAVSLTLYGDPNATAGRYVVGTLTRLSDVVPVTRPSVWEGRWTRSVQIDNGQPRQVIHLHGAPSNDINLYAVGPGNTLQPTSAYLGRNLTRQELIEYTLQPGPNALPLPR